MDRGTKIIKKSPFVIIKSLLFVEVGAVFIYLVAALLGHYAKIYRSLPIADYLSFQIAQALFIFVIQGLILIYIFFRWSSEAYIFNDNRIVHSYGIFHRKEKQILFDDIESSSWGQGLMGHLAKYGYLKIKTKSGKTYFFRYIPDPKKYADHLNNLKTIKDSSKIFKEPPDIDSLLNKDENEALEFKSSFRWDLKGNKINKSLERATMKTIAAFLNSQGGHLVIGVDDGKNPVGLENDFVTLAKQNADGFENHFSNIFHSMIGPTFRHYINLTHMDIGGKSCCVVSVSPSFNPAYLKTEDQNEEFYIRTGNGTTSLKLSEANKYIRTRFRNANYL